MNPRLVSLRPLTAGFAAALGLTAMAPRLAAQALPAPEASAWTTAQDHANMLHLTLTGYEVWAAGLKPIFTELLGVRAASDHAPPPTGDPSAANRK